MLGVLLCAWFGTAFASHPGAASLYEVLGFTADGKYVHFKKTNVAPPQEAQWLAVYEVATAKSKTAQPVYRDCGGIECQNGAPIDKKTGDKTIAQLNKTYGAPVPASILGLKAKVDEATARKAMQQPTGYAQVFAANGVEVKTATKLIGKLGDLSDGNSKSAQFDLEITVTVGGSAWTVKQQIYADSVSNLDNGNILEWPELYVQQLAVAPDRKSIALVFARKPYVLAQPKK